VRRAGARSQPWPIRSTASQPAQVFIEDMINLARADTKDYQGLTEKISVSVKSLTAWFQSEA
jgi:hypothetical protein